MTASVEIMTRIHVYYESLHELKKIVATSYAPVTQWLAIVGHAKKCSN